MGSKPAETPTNAGGSGAGRLGAHPLSRRLGKSGIMSAQAWVRRKALAHHGEAA
jgi:hypothetical protein